MSKFDISDFETLQKGLKALVEKSKNEDDEERQKILKRIKSAKNALDVIGVY